MVIPQPCLLECDDWSDWLCQNLLAPSGAEGNVGNRVRVIWEGGDGGRVESDGDGRVVVVGVIGVVG